MQKNEHSNLSEKAWALMKGKHDVERFYDMYDVNPIMFFMILAVEPKKIYLNGAAAKAILKTVGCRQSVDFESLCGRFGPTEENLLERALEILAVSDENLSALYKFRNADGYSRIIVSTMWTGKRDANNRAEFFMGTSFKLGAQLNVNVHLNEMVDEKEEKRYAADLAKLKALDKAILRLVVDGMRNDEIGKKLFRSAETIKNRKKRMYETLGIHGVEDLIVFAFKSGFVRFCFCDGFGRLRLDDDFG
ncbi:MAG: LuxR C-terminal-related transcriptional regulator [Bacteroidota bacterium]